MNPSVKKNGVILALFAIVTTLSIGVTDLLTKDIITQQRENKLKSTLAEVVPNNLYNNLLIQDCIKLSLPPDQSKMTHRIYRARMDDKPIALAIENTAPNGYNGNIDFIVGVDIHGNVLGVRVIQHQETPGLGDKIDLSISRWILSFTGKTYTNENAHLWEVKKDGGQFDQFTGATITPRALVNSVAHTLKFVQQHQSNLFALDNSCEFNNSEFK